MERDQCLTLLNLKRPALGGEESRGQRLPDFPGSTRVRPWRYRRDGNRFGFVRPKGSRSLGCHVDREFLNLTLLIGRPNHMGVQLHGMSYPPDVPFGLFPALTDQDLVERPAGDDRVHDLAVHGSRSIPKRCPSGGPLLFGGFQLEHRLTGYSHPLGQLFRSHSKRLPKRPDPPFARRVERCNFSQFLEPFFQLSQLYDTKSFCHNSLYGVWPLCLLAIYDERKNNMSPMHINDNENIVILSRRWTQLPESCLGPIIRYDNSPAPLARRKCRHSKSSLRISN